MESIPQKTLVKKGEWDVMLVLDACRFDYFERFHKFVYQNEGFLLKAESPATWTFGWLNDIFPETVNAIFVSSDYEVNSKGIRDEKIFDRRKRKKYGHIKYDAREHFKHIIDVWEFGVDEKVGYVVPETICSEVDFLLEKNGSTKVIANFWQLHDPYLYYIKAGQYPVINMEDVDRRNKMVYKWVNLKRYISHFLSDESIWKIQRFLKKYPKSGWPYLWMKFGTNGIIIGYKEDLLYTLRCIKKITDAYPNKTFVITSDHGELLGEHGRYGHTANKDYPELKEVPWFVIPRREQKSGKV